MKFAKIFSIILIAAISISILGCSSPDKKTTKTKAKAVTTKATQGQEQVVLQMWVMPNSLEPIKDIENLLVPFEKAHPNIKVQITSVDWGSAWTKITTAATSGDSPDIVQLGSTWVGAISGMGGLVDLSGKVTEIGGGASFVSAAWTTAGLEGSGQVTSIPWFIDCRAAYYRTDVFKKLGLSISAFDSWQSFENTLKKIKEAKMEIEGVHIYPLGISGKNDWNVIHNFSPWIWGSGGDYLSADRKNSAINSKAAVEGVVFYTNLVKNDYIPLECLELNTAQVSSNFNNGSYAIYFDGPYEIKTLTSPPEQGGAAGSVASRNFGIAHYPAGPKGRFTFIGGSNLSVFKYSKHQDEAWEVIKYLVSPDAQISYCKVNGFLPSKLAAFDNPFIKNDPYRKVFIDAIKYGRTYPCISSWGLLEPVLIRRLGIMWDHFLRGADDLNKLVTEELALAAQEINSVLSAGK